MNSNRKTAIIVGVLYIIGTVAGVISFGIAGPILSAPDYLTAVAANENQMIIGALFVLIMAFPLAMVPVMLFPIFKKYNEPLALGSIVFRGVLEAVTYIAISVSWLLLITLSQEFVKAGTPDASHFQALGTLLLETGHWLDHILAIVFCLGALMIYYIFYQSKLIPRWLSGWGLVGALLYIATPLLNLFDPQHPVLTVTSGVGILMAPLALQEMIMALWLIFKGFNPSAIDSGSANTDENKA